MNKMICNKDKKLNDNGSKKMINDIYKSQSGTHVRNEAMDVIQTNVRIDLKELKKK